MSGEIHWRGLVTGVTNYYTLRAARGADINRYWDTTGTPALVDLTTANWANYKIALAESPAGSYLYVGTWPATLTTVGWYYADIYRQSGAGAAIADVLVGSFLGYWDGTSYKIAGSDVQEVKGIAQSAGDIVGLIGAIGSGTGAALNFAPDSDNATTAIKTISKVGTQTNSYLSLTADNGVYHVLTNVGNAIDWVYGYSIGGGRTAAKVTFTGYLAASNPATSKTITVSAYNFVTPGWDTIRTITGQAGTTDITVDIPLLSAHTGTGTDAGKVYIRFTATAQAGAVLNADMLLVQAQVTGQTVGYSDGSIWVDTVSGTAGTTPFVNGTADKPVLTWADALTLAGLVGIRSFHFLPGSSIQLTGSSIGYRFIGAATIALGGQNIADAYFRDAYTISGVSTGDDAEFINCGIGTCTLAHSYLIDCRFKGTVTLIAAQEYFIIRGSDAVTGTSTPAQFTYSANCEIDFRDWRGGVQLNGHAATNTTFIDGAGRILIDTATGGNLTIRGDFAPASGATATALTITQTQRYGTDQITAASDPLVNAVPGAYAAGTAGAALGSIPAIKGQTDLISGAEITLAQGLTGGAAQVIRGSTWTASIPCTADLATRTLLQLAFKWRVGDTDAQAILYGTELAGLTRVNGATYTGSSAHLTLTVDPGVAINVVLSNVVTALLDPAADIAWAAQYKLAGGTVVEWSGALTVVGDYIRTVA